MRLLSKALVAVGWVVAGMGWAGMVQATSLDAPASVTFTEAAPALTADARYVADWALQTNDHRRQPFAVVDKKSARVYVFEADGHLVGSAHVLLGSAPGDHSVPGVGDGDVNRIPLADRTTPAGRFASQPGRNLDGDSVVWFDYTAALAIHRVRPGASQLSRMEQLATATPDDNRASLGCVVVTPEFFDAVIKPVLGQRRGVVYVLPESQPVQAMFGAPQPVAQQQR
jgi:hypothetical protein